MDTDINELAESPVISTSTDEEPLSPFVSPIEKGGKKVDIKLENMLTELKPLIRFDDLVVIYDKANTCGMEEVIDCLKETIPDVNDYLAGLPEDMSAEDKLNAIREGLRERAEALVATAPMPAPDLGAEVDEARSKQEAPELSRRIKTQYAMTPSVGGYNTGRSSVVSPYNTRRSPIRAKKGGKSTRILMV